MRITNNMMLRNASSNINGNKINVNAMENQMSSQKKIQRPSDDPVIAVRALRLRSSLSEINQYYENNIPDAESWLEVTETALKNMEKILTDIRTQCEYGSGDQLTADNRKAILTALEKLRQQVYSEGNADYAGRTVFTGYRTNQKLTFMQDDASTKYEITQKFTYADLEEYRYYSDKVTVPATPGDLLNPANTVPNPQEAVFQRIRLSYGKIDSLDNAGSLSYSYTDNTGTVQTSPITVTEYETFEEWKAQAGGYTIADGEAVFIKESGELIMSKGLSDDIRENKGSLELNYTKTGFAKGEVRPEYYYNCKDVTNPDPDKQIEYTKFDANGKEIYQDINYLVAANQTLTVNTQASDVFDASLGRDVDALIEAVRFAQEANAKVEEIEKMQKMQEYSSDDSQAALEEWLVAAKKEAAYAEDNMQKLYNSYIGNCDGYLSKVLLAKTSVGSKGESLELTKNRMENQQTTVETLKSENEDRELSDIIIDYTAAYSAYEASLQAAAKINQNTLLNFI